MGRIVHVYTDWQNLAVPGTGGASVDLLEVKLGAAQFAYVMGAYLFQSSEEGVTDIEEMKVALKRASGSYTSGGGTGGLSPTIKKGATGDPAHGFATTKMLSTTQASAGSGTLDTLWPGVFSIPAGEWERTFIPEMRIPLAPSEAIILSLEEAFADTVTLNAMLILDVTG